MVVRWAPKDCRWPSVEFLIPGGVEHGKRMEKAA